MTSRARTAPVGKPAGGTVAGGSSELPTEPKPAKTKERNMAETALDPAAHAVVLAEKFNRGSFGEQPLEDVFVVLHEQIEAAKGGDLSHHGPFSRAKRRH